MRFFKKVIIKTLIFLSLLFVMFSAIGLGVYSRYPLYYKDHIGESSDRHNLDPYLVTAIINVESGFNKNAISSKDARGLMQIAEKTGKWGAEQLGVDDYKNEDLFDPKLNIEFGTWYLEKLGEEFDGDLNIILAAYNGGSGNVNKWLKDEKHSKDGKKLDNIPFKETENYVKRVRTNYKTYKKIYGDIDFKNKNYDSIFINYIYKLKSYIKEID